MFNEPASGEPRQHPLERPPSAPPPPPAPTEERRRHPLERPPQGFRPPPTRPGGPPPPRVTIRFAASQSTVTYVLIALNVLVFVIRALSPTLDAQIFDWGADNARAVLVDHEVYRLLSSMFLHAGIYDPLGRFQFGNSLHLLLNMYVLYAVGVQLEKVLGHARFLVIYILGGLTASLVSVLINGPDVVSVGASGAVFAVLAAEFVYFYQNRKIYGRMAMARMQSLVWLALINFGFGFFTTAFSAGMQVDNWAHLGGLVGGLAVTWLVGATAAPQVSEDRLTVTLGTQGSVLRDRLGLILLYCIGLVGVLIVASRG